MEHIGVHEAKTNLSKLIKRIELGEEFAITNRGKVVAVISHPERNAAKRGRKAIEALEALSKRINLGRFDEVMEWRKEGRK